MKMAILVGLTRVDPEAYQGWDGDCPGCDLDVMNMHRAFHESGRSSAVLLNEFATVGKLENLFVAQYINLKRDDFLMLFFSGHGGQQPDRNNDEADGKDETLCMYNGELVDDQIGDMLSMIPEGVRVLMITDSCNSGTNFRARGRNIEKSSPVSVGRVITPRFKAKLIHFGGCADGRSSYGGDEGGVFTNALMKVRREWDAANAGELTNQIWFANAGRLMPRNQIPVYAEYGDVGDFRNMKILE